MGLVVDPIQRVFQSTPPRREVTQVEATRKREAEFQSTPPRREVTLADADDAFAGGISIHTSPKGGDWLGAAQRGVASDFNPHLPEGR